MFQVLTILVSLGDSVLAIWFPRAAWFVLGILETFFITQLFIMRMSYRLPDLGFTTPEMEALRIKYGHYFLLPAAAKDFSASSGTLQFASILLAGISWFEGFKVGALLAVATWFVMGYTAHSLSPVAVLARHPEFRDAHNEIFRLLQSRQVPTGK